MYYIKKADNGSYCEFVCYGRYGAAGDRGTSYNGGMRLKLSLVKMSYTERTATLSYDLNWHTPVYGSTGIKTSDLSDFKVYIGGVQIYSAYSIAIPESYSRLSIATGTVTLPYDSNGTLDSMRLSWSCSYQGETYTQTDVGGYDGKYVAVDGGFIRDLQQEPFFTVQPFSETWNTSSAELPSSYWVNETDSRDYRLIVPYVPSGATTLRLKINSIWVIDIANPEVTRYEGTLVFDAAARERIYDWLSSTGSGTRFVGDFDIGFVSNGKFTSYSKAAPFHINVVAGKPEVSGTVVDTNAVTIGLTGNASVLVRYVSNALATINAKATTGANLATTTITNGSTIVSNAESYVFEKVENNTFEFYAVDNRYINNYAEVIAPMVDYVVPTATVRGSVITGDGDMSIRVSGSYFDGSFGAATNEIFVYYRYKEQGAEDSEYTDWIKLNDIQIDSVAHTYTVGSTVSGLNYEKTYIFQAQIADIIFTINSPDYVAVSKPVFDWSSTDFNFNVPVTIMGKTYGGEEEPEEEETVKILWSGVDIMKENTVINLSEPISAQKNGIILVFGYSDSDTGWNTFYVPKIMVQLNNDGGQTFLMAINSGFSAFGAKYLYIHDTNIEGQSSNGVQATNSGINYTNSVFNLRYVIGV